MLASTFKHIRRWPLIIPAALLDGVFVIGFVLLHANTFMKAASSITELTMLMQDLTGKAGSASQLNEALLASARFKELFHTFLVLLLILFLGGFALWVIFHGAAAYLSQQMAGQRQPYLPFLGKYAWLSALWGTAFLLLVVLSVKLASAAFAPLPVVSERVATTVVFLLLAVLGYFASISYALIPVKRTLRTAFKLAVSRAARQLIPRYLGAVVLVTVLALNVIFFLNIHAFAGAAALFLLFLPGMAIARLLIAPAALAAAKA